MTYIKEVQKIFFIDRAALAKQGDKWFGSTHWEKSGAKTNGATLEGGAVFSLIVMFRKKMQLDVDIEPTFRFTYMKCKDKDITMKQLTFCEPKRLHPWSQNGQGGAVSDLFFVAKNSSTFESGTKIVPRVELSYVPWNGSRGGAVLALLFFSVPVCPLVCAQAYIKKACTTMHVIGQTVQTGECTQTDKQTKGCRLLHYAMRSITSAVHSITSLSWMQREGWINSFFPKMSCHDIFFAWFL